MSKIYFCSIRSLLLKDGCLWTSGRLCVISHFHSRSIKLNLLSGLSIFCFILYLAALEN